MEFNKKGAVIGGEERIRGWLRSRQPSRIATGCDRPFRELNLHILEVRLAARVCVQANLFYVYLQLMGNFTIRKTCGDAAIFDGKSRRPQRLNSKLGPMHLPFFPIRRIAPGPYFFSSINRAWEPVVPTSCAEWSTASK